MIFRKVILVLLDLTSCFITKIRAVFAPKPLNPGNLDNLMVGGFVPYDLVIPSKYLDDPSSSDFRHYNVGVIVGFYKERIKVAYFNLAESNIPIFKTYEKEELVLLAGSLDMLAYLTQNLTFKTTKENKKGNKEAGGNENGGGGFTVH